MQGKNPLQPLIIIAAARSGTRLLRDTLASHPGISKVPYDVNYLWRIGNEHLNHDELEPERIDQVTQERIRGKITSYNKGTGILVEKTVSNCLRVPFVDAIFADALYINLVRDGMDVIESAYRKWTSPPDWGYILRKMFSYPLIDAPAYAFSYVRSTLRKLIASQDHRSYSWGPRYRGIDQDIATRDCLEVCAIQWQASTSLSREAFSLIPGNRLYSLRYEDFVTNPIGCLEELASFLNINPDPFREHIDLPKITQDNIGKGKSVLTPDQMDIITPYLT
jgi:hypothetical protein